MKRRKVRLILQKLYHYHIYPERITHKKTMKKMKKKTVQTWLTLLFVESQSGKLLLEADRAIRLDGFKIRSLLSARCASWQDAGCECLLQWMKT